MAPIVSTILGETSTVTYSRLNFSKRTRKKEDYVGQAASLSGFDTKNVCLQSSCSLGSSNFSSATEMSFLICAISASKKNETRKHKSKKSERMHPCVVPHQNGQKNSVSPLRRRDKYKKGPLNDELKGASGVKQYISCQQMKPSVF